MVTKAGVWIDHKQAIVVLLTDADQEIKKYEDLHRSEEAALEKERKEMKQFVTVLQQSSPKR